MSKISGIKFFHFSCIYLLLFCTKISICIHIVRHIQSFLTLFWFVHIDVVSLTVCRSAVYSAAVTELSTQPPSDRCHQHKLRCYINAVINLAPYPLREFCLLLLSPPHFPCVFCNHLIIILNRKLLRS